MISMGVTLRPDCVVGQDARDGFHVGTESFEMHLKSGKLQTRATINPDAPLVLSGNGNALARAIYGKSPLTRRVDMQIVGATGDLEAAQEFANPFTLKP